MNGNFMNEICRYTRKQKILRVFAHKLNLKKKFIEVKKKRIELFRNLYFCFADFEFDEGYNMLNINTYKVGRL